MILNFWQIQLEMMVVHEAPFFLCRQLDENHRNPQSMLHQVLLNPILNGLRSESHQVALHFLHDGRKE